jgi:hypothetical protein
LAFAGETFRKSAVNFTCCAGDISVGTVAVEGVTEVRIPVSSDITAVPVFFLFASAVALNEIVGMGFGKSVNVGAVYVKTLLGDVGVVVHDPRLPLPKADTFCPEVQLRGPTCAGFGCAVVGFGVYS